MATRASTDGHDLKPPPQQQNVAQRPSTAPQGAAQGQSFQSVREQNEQNELPEAEPGYQHFVLSDPTAFRYLEADPSTSVVERQRELQGYECYIVEQWATSRSHPTSTITTHTGNLSHKVVVGVLSVPVDESAWSPRLRVYFKALNQYHARRKETHLGILMVTNLSGFPSSLTVLAVPDGDLRRHRLDFFVNEDLKRMGCSGRVGLGLVPPTSATVAKFYQLYRTSDKNDLYKSVIELVKLCQSALILFDKLDVDYGDGLLCDHTERAINDWWLDIGSEVYSTEPHDGILGPTTVAALLGLVLGARSRLHAMNHSVAKDPFDMNSMKRGISAFQKSQRLPRTRRLDRKTVDRLHQVSARAANSESWKVPKAVKSTVAELSGKGGEMVMDAVGRRDRAGIAEVETCDIERFSQLVYGAPCLWLWFGKPMKKKQDRQKAGNIEEMVDNKQEFNGKGLTFREGDHGGYTWTARKSTVDGKVEPYDDMTNPAGQETDEEDGEQRPGLLKRTGTSGFKGAKSGLGRFKGAVGLSGHQQKSSQDDSIQSLKSPTDGSMKTNRRMLPHRTHTSPVSSPNSPRFSEQEFSSHQSSKRSEHTAPAYTQTAPEQFQTSKESLPPSYVSNNRRIDNEESSPRQDQDEDDRPETASEPSIAGSIYNDIDLNEILPTGPETEQHVGRLLRRTLSFSHYIAAHQPHPDAAYPRHLSFSLAEDSILTWPPLTTATAPPDTADLNTQLALAQHSASTARTLRQNLNQLATTTSAWTTAQFPALHALLSKLDADLDDLDAMYRPHADAMQSLQATSESILRSEKERLEEGTREIETLGAKLEYEINALRGRIEEVESGVEDFGDGVRRVEERVRELEWAEEKEAKGWGCVVS